jgi:hypothetical protein
MQMVADRIEQLGGLPDFNPDGPALRIAALSDCNGDFAIRIAENLATEQSIIDALLRPDRLFFRLRSTNMRHARRDYQ